MRLQNKEATLAEQNFKNHTKIVPAFHYFVLPVFALNFVQSILRWKHAGFNFDGLVGVLTATGLIALAFVARTMALKVQDRVIRLEERLRFKQLLPADLQPRITEFTPGQLVALRFACDAEIPMLARKVLDDKVSDVKAIKQMVQTWRADYLRA
jgi:uncharacterized membrane protein YciS (DUF1049 family)